MLEMKVVACLLWGYRHQNPLLKRGKEKKRAVGCRLWYSATGQSTKNQTGKWDSSIERNVSSINFFKIKTNAHPTSHSALLPPKKRKALLRLVACGLFDVLSFHSPILYSLSLE
jgi:type II secretory pathway component PulJ